MEEGIFNSCPSNYKPNFYRRYLDDTLALFNCEVEAKEFFEFIKGRHRNISFTMEKQHKYK